MTPEAPVETAGRREEGSGGARIARGGGLFFFGLLRTWEGRADAEARGALGDVVVREDADRAGDAAAEELAAVLGEDSEQEPAERSVRGEAGERAREP